MSVNLSKVKETYFNKLFLAAPDSGNARATTTPSSSLAQGPKVKPRVLLLDKFTTPIISMCYTQSQLLANDVILIELVENHHQLSSMKHLDCIVYIKPCQESINFLCQELRNPHFGQYRLFLNNCINKNQLESVAEADQYEVIDKVMEIFQDYLIVNDNLYVIDNIYLSQQVNPVLLESEKLISLLLALKKTPIIKYESNSIDLKRLSSEILYQINSNSNNNLFDDLNRNSDTPPLLILLDRKNDPITPLVTPWTYQSMIHEFMTIQKNIVKLNDEDSASQIVISEENDPFYKESMYLNYGDLTEKFQRYVEKYKSETKQSSIENLKSSNLSELKKVLTKFPEFKKFSTNVLTHLNLIGEIDKQLSSQNLWEIGELQQTIACDLENQHNLRTSVLEVLDNAGTKRVSTINKIKLVLLYSYRHNNPSDLSLFLQKLNNPELTSPLPTESQVQLIKRFKTLFNANNAVDRRKLQEQNEGLTNIFSNKKIDINKLFNRNNANSSKSDNIYLQYTPRLNEILAGLINPSQDQEGSLGLSTLVPDKVKQQYGSSVINEPVQDVIIYIKGGVTYEEGRLVYELSESNKRINLIVGGDAVLNSTQWLEKLYSIANNDKDPTGGERSNADRQTQLREIL
ncbi:Vacuolar protein sorting-associated protein 45 [Candida viswanathii]|uniref:Vacuolar protein sorting-associated protein 45 n=1 Tax=Candida viswanathii TaxID=5486 RepID=A0A367YRP9_9ASCO|nr:Vacuolar protein sorting-associated protein 45 [Candida viswanathii]